MCGVKFKKEKRTQIMMCKKSFANIHFLKNVLRHCFCHKDSKQTVPIYYSISKPFKKQDIFKIQTRHSDKLYSI